MEMPPSLSFRSSPVREPRSDSHKRGRSLESGLPSREKDDDLALFSEMQSREEESFLLQPSDDLEDSFCNFLYCHLEKRMYLFFDCFIWVVLMHFYPLSWILIYSVKVERFS